jgi:hypothetical protein
MLSIHTRTTLYSRLGNADYAEYIPSFINVRDSRIRVYIEEKLKAGVLWPQPLIQLTGRYQCIDSRDDAPREGFGIQDCLRYRRLRGDAPVAFSVQADR